MSEQLLPFCEALAPRLLLTDPQEAWLAEQQRRDTHCWRILALLQQGARTNRELAQISLDYRRRVSDLREQGHTIVCSPIDGKPGLTRYELS